MIHYCDKKYIGNFTLTLLVSAVIGWISVSVLTNFISIIIITCIIACDITITFQTIYRTIVAEIISTTKWEIWYCDCSNVVYPCGRDWSKRVSSNKIQWYSEILNEITWFDECVFRRNSYCKLCSVLEL